MVNQYCAHSFARNWQLPFLNQQKAENDGRKYFMIDLHKRILLTRWGLNPQPPDHQSDTHPTEPPRPAKLCLFYPKVIHITCILVENNIPNIKTLLSTNIFFFFKNYANIDRFYLKVDQLINTSVQNSMSKHIFSETIITRLHLIFWKGTITV